MQRIVIIGCSGSGKSTLTRVLGVRLGIGVTHLDVLYWRPGWKPHPDTAAFRCEVLEVVLGERWIIDGNFNGTLPQRLARADTMILLDLPMVLCLWRVLWRVVEYWGKRRSDLPLGCNEQAHISLLHYVWTYRRRELPEVEAAAEHFNGTLVRLTSPRAVAAFLASVPAGAHQENRKGRQ